MEKMFYLMNRDRKLLAFYIEKRGGMEVCVEDARLSHRMPPDYDSGGLDSWIRLRFRGGQRRHLNAYVESGNRETSRFIALTRGLSLYDTLWIQGEDENLAWADVSLYRNPFDTGMADFAFGTTRTMGEPDGRGMPDLTTGGKFYKCWERDGEGKIWLVKNGLADDGRMALMGREPYGEVLASQVFEKLVPGACRYSLVERGGAPASRCLLFTSEEEGHQAFATYVHRDATLYSMIAPFEAVGCGDLFRRMIVADCVTFNADRHTDNFGFMVDNATWEKKRMSPAYDLNQCFFPYLSEGELSGLDDYLAGHTSALGYDYVEPAKNFLNDEIRADLINLKDLELTVPTDDLFTERRLEMVNEMKNVQIDRILGEKRSFSFADTGRHPFFWPFGRKR